jgi:hypothetical protein
MADGSIQFCITYAYSWRVYRIICWLVTGCYAGPQRRVEYALHNSPRVAYPLTMTTVIPWGRLIPIRKDLGAAGKSEAEGGTGIATKFWEWSEEQVKPYL